MLKADSELPKTPNSTFEALFSNMNAKDFMEGTGSFTPKSHGCKQINPCGGGKNLDKILLYYYTLDKTNIPFA